MKKIWPVPTLSIALTGSSWGCDVASQHWLTVHPSSSIIVVCEDVQLGLAAATLHDADQLLSPLDDDDDDDGSLEDVLDSSVDTAAAVDDVLLDHVTSAVHRHCTLSVQLHNIWNNQMSK